jgi:hypothetical protein
MFCKIFWENGVFKMKNKWFLFSGVLLVFGFMLAACDNPNSEETGPLVGTSWEMKYITSGSYGINQTNTYSFTGSSTGKFTRTGWYRINNKITNYTGNEDFGFTYVYSPEMKTGAITENGATTPRGVFSISGDFRTLSFTSGSPYTRK